MMLDRLASLIRLYHPVHFQHTRRAVSKKSKSTRSARGMMAMLQQQQLLSGGLNAEREVALSESHVDSSRPYGHGASPPRRSAFDKPGGMQEWDRES